MAGQPLFIMLCSQEHEKIQLAAMTASIAAVSERPVSVLVTMNAVLSFENGLSTDQRYIGGTFSKMLVEKNAPDAVELFGQGKMLGELSMYACSMAMDMLDWDLTNLEAGLFDDSVGLTKFLSDAEGAQLMVM